MSKVAGVDAVSARLLKNRVFDIIPTGIFLIFKN